MALFDLGYMPHAFKSSRPGYQGTYLHALYEKFPTEWDCIEHILNVRHTLDPKCPRCGKRGRWRRHDFGKHYFHPCGGIVSPMTNCVFDRTRVDLRLWFYAMLIITNSAEGISGQNLARHLGVSAPTAFRMLSRIRHHMAALDEKLQLGNISKPVMCRIFTSRKVLNGQRNTQNRARILVFTDGQNIRSSVIFRPKRSDIIALIEANVAKTASLATDCYWTARTLSAYGSGRPLAEYNPAVFQVICSDRDVIHGYVSYVRQSFFDQYRGVNLDNFWLYLKEYEFRFNRRSNSQNTFWEIISAFPNLRIKDRQRLAESFSRANLKRGLC